MVWTALVLLRLSKSDFHCTVKMCSQKQLRMKICRKGHKHTEKVHKNQSNKVKRGHFYSSAFKNQNFAQVVDNFAQTCVCVSAAFRNSGASTPSLVWWYQPWVCSNYWASLTFFCLYLSSPPFYRM